MGDEGRVTTKMLVSFDSIFLETACTESE